MVGFSRPEPVNLIHMPRMPKPIGTEIRGYWESGVRENEGVDGGAEQGFIILAAENEGIDGDVADGKYKTSFLSFQFHTNNVVDSIGSSANFCNDKCHSNNTF